ncbi:MAG: hypothetical protein H7Z75_09950 [Ferruginibacter sp.]|nr:hypothetical protein [Cytophagales bacterium]
MNPRLAHLLSALFHPLLMPTMLYAVIFYFSPVAVGPLNNQFRLLMLAGIVITTFLIPALFIYILYQAEAVGDLRLEDQRERTLPFLVTTVVYGTFTYFFYWKLDQLATISLVLGSITVAVALVTLINLFWKISAHSVGISGVVGSLVGIHYKFADTDLFYPILLAIVLAGWLMSARLSLNAHHPSQVLAGCLLGLGISFGTVWWLV